MMVTGGSPMPHNALIVEGLKHNRRDRIFGYGLVCSGAVAALFWAREAPVSVNVMNDYSRVAFISVFILAAGMCFLGALIDYWLLEYVALVPLLGCFGIYGIAVIAMGITVVGWQVVPTGLSMLGFSLIFRGRRTDLKIIYTIELAEIRARHEQRKDDKDEQRKAGGE